MKCKTLQSKKTKNFIITLNKCTIKDESNYTVKEYNKKFKTEEISVFDTLRKSKNYFIKLLK